MKFIKKWWYVLLIACVLLVCLYLGVYKYIRVSEINEQLFILAESSIEECETALDNCDKLQEMYDEVVKENATLKVAEKPVYEYTEEEIYLLAQCVEAEAGYNKDSQLYVTQVIINRVFSSQFPNTISEVIYQKVSGVPQFSVAYNGMIDREVKPETLSNVYIALIHGTDLPSYVLYFYSNSVKNNWVKSLNVYDEVAGTIFAYTTNDKENLR